MKNLFLGIDPGLSGAFVLIDSASSVVLAEKMPTVPSGKKDRQEISADGLLALFRRLTSPFGDDPTAVRAILEKVQAFPRKGRCPKCRSMISMGQGGVSNLSYGIGFGMLRMVLSVFKIPFEEKRPTDWQKEFGISSHSGDTKHQARMVASKLFPDLPRRPRAGDVPDGVADAALMAEFLRRKYQNV